MTKQDLFDYAAIPVIILVTLFAFIAAYMGWI